MKPLHELNELEVSSARLAGTVAQYDERPTPSGVRETSSGLSETSPDLGEDSPKLQIIQAPTSDPRFNPTAREYQPPPTNLPEKISQSQILADSRTRLGNITGWPSGALVTESDND